MWLNDLYSAHIVDRMSHIQKCCPSLGRFFSSWFIGQQGHGETRVRTQMYDLWDKAQLNTAQYAVLPCCKP